MTLQAYGPDTKAALVLTPVQPPVGPSRTPSTRRSPTFAPVSTTSVFSSRSLISVQEAFEAQPLVLLHGIQAGMVQRALRLSDGVRSRVEAGEGPVRVARIEPGWPALTFRLGVPTRSRCCGAHGTRS